MTTRRHKYTSLGQPSATPPGGVDPPPDPPPSGGGGSGGGDAAGNPTGLTYGGTYTITSGGTYTAASMGGHKSRIIVNTSAAVVIQNVAIKGPPSLVDLSYGNCDVTLRNVYLEGTAGTTSSTRGVWAPNNCKRLIVENCKGSNLPGIKVTQSASMTQFRCRFNKWRNVIGLPGGDFVQFLQIDGVACSDFLVQWNEVINTPGASHVEDNISYYRCGGPDSSHRWGTYDNLLWGAYPYAAFTQSSYTGGGIMHNDFSVATLGHLDSARNVVLGTSANYGISIVGGTDTLVHDNIVVSSGYAEDGRKIAASTSGPPNSLVLWFPSWQPAGTPTNNRIENNISGYWTSVSGVRKDGWWESNGQPASAGNYMGGTTLLKPGQAITWADEKAQYDAWSSRRIAAGITIGPNW